MVPEHWALYKCQSSNKTIRGSHVWQSSPSMWLLTDGNILEQFGLIFGEQAPFSVPVYSVRTWPFATCSVLPLQGCLHSLRVKDVVLISGFIFFFSYANGGCSLTWWGPNVALKMLITFDRWWELRVPGNFADGRCTTRLTSMSVWADGYCNKKHSSRKLCCRWLRIRTLIYINPPWFKV